MSLFKNIDPKLEAFATKFDARISKDRPGYPAALRTFEERRIDWTDEGINKAVIIQPTFGFNGVDSSRWNYLNIAWCNDSRSGKRLSWIERAIVESSFAVIEREIDRLLKESAEKLQLVKISDLGHPSFPLPPEAAG